MSGLVNQTVRIPCAHPSCGSTLPLTVRKLGDGGTVTCPRGHRTELTADAKARQELRKADTAMRDLERSVAKLRQTLRRL